MFKAAASHIEAHIPDTSAKEHAKVIERALHENDYFVHHSNAVKEAADEALNKGCDDDYAA